MWQSCKVTLLPTRNNSFCFQPCNYKNVRTEVVGNMCILIGSCKH